MTDKILRFPLAKPSNEPSPKKKILSGTMLCPVCEDTDKSFEIDIQRNARGLIKIVAIKCCVCGEFYEVENGFLK